MDAITNKTAGKTFRRPTLRTVTVSLIAALLVVLGLTHGRKLLAGSSAINDSLAQPASCRLVLASLPGDKAIDREIADQQTIIVRGSSSAMALERLGWTFVKKARVSFDAGYYKFAEQCAACLEARGSRGPETLLLRAHALQSLHRFVEAEAAARELASLRQRPFDYGVLGDILIDQGKIREGASAYQQMVDLRPDLQSYARAAHVRWLTGDLQGAIRLMELATDASSPNDSEAAAWAFTRLALYQLQRGATKQALVSCDSALGVQSDYAPAMLARGRILLAIDRSADAVVELRRAAQLNPLPEYQWALAEALVASGSRTEAAEIESQLVKGNTEDPRTLALYLATRRQDVDRAVRLAQQELSNRGDVFTHDALAWALAAAGRTTEAQQHVTHALSEGTADARLFLHAGVIAGLNNDNARARQWLSKATATQYMLLPSERLELDVWRERTRSNTLQTSKATQP